MANISFISEAAPATSRGNYTVAAVWTSFLSVSLRPSDLGLTSPSALQLRDWARVQTHSNNNNMLTPLGGSAASRTNFDGRLVCLCKSMDVTHFITELFVAALPFLIK